MLAAGRSRSRAGIPHFASRSFRIYSAFSSESPAPPHRIDAIVQPLGLPKRRIAALDAELRDPPKPGWLGPGASALRIATDRRRGQRRGKRPCATDCRADRWKPSGPGAPAQLASNSSLCSSRLPGYAAYARIVRPGRSGQSRAPSRACSSASGTRTRLALAAVAVHREEAAVHAGGRDAVLAVRCVGRPGSSGERLLERAALGGAGLLVALAPGLGDADEDAAPVVRAHAARARPSFSSRPTTARARSGSGAAPRRAPACAVAPRTPRRPGARAPRTR